MKPATKVVFPGMEFGSTEASPHLSLIDESGGYDLTFVEVSCHALIITTDEGVILGDTRSLAPTPPISEVTLLQCINWFRAPGKN